MTDFLKILGGGVLLVAAVVAVIVGTAVSISALSCHGTGTGMEIETRWTFGGCYVNTNHGWVPESYVFGSTLEIRYGGKDRPVPIKRAAK